MAQLYLKGVYYDTESGGLWYLDNSGSYQEVATGGSSYLVYTALLTDSEFKNLQVSSLELLAAPGVGKAIVPFRFFFAANFNVGYQVNGGASIDNDRIAVQYGELYEVGDIVNTTDSSAFAEFISDKLTWSVPPVTDFFNSVWGGNTCVQSIQYDLIENNPLKVQIYTTNGAMTGGDSLNTLKITVFYSIIDL